MAVWTTAYINDLPDSAFLYIEPGGTKDSEGKTVPRSLRHFPVRDANGRLDLPHLRNALSRIPQSDLPAAVKERLTASARRLLEQAGGGRAAAELETEDILGVEILAAGGPIHGHGSPPEGDHLTVDDLQAFADAARELGPEWSAPLKIGHSPAQRLARASGLLTDDERLQSIWRLATLGLLLVAALAGIAAVILWFLVG